MSTSADALQASEIEAARAAYKLLVEALHQLSSALDRETSAPPGPRNLAKLAAAQTALQRHADMIVDTYGYLDGHRLNAAEDGLLTVFYSAANDIVASRYCWALLHFPAPLELPQIIAAMEVEHDAFRSRHDRNAGASDAIELLAATADRLGYTLAILQRTLLVYRALKPAADEVVQDLASLATAVAEADDTLQAMRLEGLRSRRPKENPGENPGMEGDGS
jgi:hypothetical protein